MSFLAVLLCTLLAVPCQIQADLVDPVASFCERALYKDNCKSIVDMSPAKNKNALIGKGLNLALASISEMGKRFSKYSKDTAAKGAIQDCTDIYGEATDLIQKSLHALSSSGGYNDVNTWVSSAMTSSDTCEASFQEAGVKSPISDINEQFSQYCSSVLAFTNHP